MADNNTSVKQPAPPIDPTKGTSKIEPGAEGPIGPNSGKATFMPNKSYCLTNSSASVAKYTAKMAPGLALRMRARP